LLLFALTLVSASHHGSKSHITPLQLLEEYDRNSDNALDEKELLVYLENFFEYPPTPPRLYKKMKFDFTTYLVPIQHPPPYVKQFPPYDGTQTGTSYYDWDKKALAEFYNKSCVSIFPGFTNMNFPCVLMNGPDHISWLISDPAKVTPEWKQYAPCCVMANPFYAMADNFLQIYLNFYSKEQVNGTNIYTYFVNTTGFGPFFYQVENNDGRKPYSLTTVQPSQHWGYQKFAKASYDFDDHIWDHSCNVATAPQCPFPAPGAPPFTIQQVPMHNGQNWCDPINMGGGGPPPSQSAPAAPKGDLK